MQPIYSSLHFVHIIITVIEQALQRNTGPDPTSSRYRASGLCRDYGHIMYLLAGTANPPRGIGLNRFDLIDLTIGYKQVLCEVEPE
ncbi:uncharacterized protein Dvar_54680 [Desulfosarcina variabilis str. Montpellier]|uniref:hypothetical protein n=1 Tax=Desulfosarcina variabilis TaxID=2300 RepID=UPI003AFA7CAB